MPQETELIPTIVVTTCRGIVLNCGGVITPQLVV